MKKRIVMLGLSCMMALGSVSTAMAMTVEEYEEWEALSTEEKKELEKQNAAKQWFTNGEGREHNIAVDDNLGVAFLTTGIVNAEGASSKYAPETFEVYLDGEYMGTPEEVYIEESKGNGMGYRKVYNDHYYEIPYGDYKNGKISYSFGGMTVDEFRPVLEFTGDLERTEEGYKFVPTFANKHEYPDSTTNDSVTATPEDYDTEEAEDKSVTATQPRRVTDGGAGVENLSDTYDVFAEMAVIDMSGYTADYVIYGTQLTNYDATGGEWYRNESNGWCYRLPNGETAVRGWLNDGQYLYYVNQYGKAAEKSWLSVNTAYGNAEEGKMYYLFDENCRMVTGWKEVEGQWYYMDASGVKQKSCVTPDGYTLDANGVWVQ